MRSLIQSRFSRRHHFPTTPVLVPSINPRLVINDTCLFVHDMFHHTQVLTSIMMYCGDDIDNGVWNTMHHFGCNICSELDQVELFNEQLLFPCVLKKCRDHIMYDKLEHPLPVGSAIIGTVCAIISGDVDLFSVSSSDLPFLQMLRLICMYADRQNFKLLVDTLSLEESVCDILSLYKNGRCVMTTHVVRFMLSRLPSKVWQQLVTSSPLFVVHCLRHFPFSMGIVCRCILRNSMHLATGGDFGGSDLSLTLHDACYGIRRWVNSKEERSVLTSITSHSTERKMWMCSIVHCRVKRELKRMCRLFDVSPQTLLTIQIIQMACLCVLTEKLAFSSWKNSQFKLLEEEWCSTTDGTTVMIESPLLPASKSICLGIKALFNEFEFTAVSRIRVNPMLFWLSSTHSEPSMAVMEPLINYRRYRNQTPK